MVFFSHSKFEQSSMTVLTDINPLEFSEESQETSSSSLDEGISLAVDCPKHRAGRKKFKETRHPVFRGVRGRKNDKWVAEIREQNSKKRIWLGTYPTAEMAARAHDVASLALRGRSACLNFADSVWRLPVPQSATAKSIKKTATEAAEIFRFLELDIVIDPETVTISVEVFSSSNFFVPEIMTSNNYMFYVDEEVEFGLPGILANMAQGLLLAPPPLVGFGSHQDDVQCFPTISLWS